MIKDLRVSDFSPAAKLLSTAVLVTYAGVHLFALWLARHVSEVAGSAQTHFAYRDLTYLLRMSHQHMFGHGTMYFVTGALFLMTDVREGLKRGIVLLPFVGAGMDLGCWWLLKHDARNWEWLSMLGGAIFTGSFLGMVFVLLRQLWRKPKA
jgi:hypothetical protein